MAPHAAEVRACLTCATAFVCLLQACQEEPQRHIAQAFQHIEQFLTAAWQTWLGCSTTPGHALHHVMTLRQHALLQSVCFPALNAELHCVMPSYIVSDQDSAVP